MMRIKQATAELIRNKELPLEMIELADKLTELSKFRFFHKRTNDKGRVGYERAIGSLFELCKSQERYMLWTENKKSGEMEILSEVRCNERMKKRLE